MADERYFPAIRQLAEYEARCNQLAIEAASKLSTQELHHRFAFGFHTIHATLFHIIEVFQTWSGSVGPTLAKPPTVPYDPQMSLDQLAEWHLTLSEAFLRAIDTSHGARLLHLDRRIQQVFHLVTHGAHHRTQFITMLRLLGKEPPFEAGDFGGWSRMR